MKSQTGSPISLPSNASVSNHNEALDNSASSPSTNTATGASFRAGGGGGEGSSSSRQDSGGQGSVPNAAAEGSVSPFAFLCTIFTSLLFTAQSFFNSTARELQQQREEHKHLFNRVIRNGSIRGASVVADYGHDWSSSAGSFGPAVPLQQSPANFQNTPNYQHVALDQSLEGHLGRQGQGGTQFALELVFNGGTGARPQRDGLSATAFPSGVWGSQIETTEAVAPVLFSRRELRQDSGGAGQYRGGLGQFIELQSAVDEDFLVFLSVERVLNPAKGRHGGQAGAAGRIRIGKDGDDLPSKGEVRVKAGDTLFFETPGGGGFGPPQDRSADNLQHDLEDGLISQTAAAAYRGKT